MKSAGISWVKRRDIIDGLNKGKRIDIVCLASKKGMTIFGSDKALKVSGGLMAGLGVSATSDIIARFNANCSIDRKRGQISKLEKGSKGAWGPGNRRSASVAALSKKKGGVSKPKAGKIC